MAAQLGRPSNELGAVRPASRSVRDSFWSLTTTALRALECLGALNRASRKFLATSLGRAPKLKTTQKRRLEVTRNMDIESRLKPTDS